MENTLLNNLFGESLSGLDTKCGRCVQTEDIYIHLISIWVKKENKAINTVPNIGLGGNVVLNLISKANLPSNHNHVLFFDNYFTSISLMKELISQGYLVTGTCRDNRSDKCPIFEKNFLKHQPRGAVDYRMSDGILLMKWKENKEVTIVSNFDSTIMKSVWRYDQKEKKIIKVPQPACIQLYNAHMRHINVMDQAVSMYRIRM